MMLPDIDGIDLVRKFKAARSGGRGHRDHRPGATSRDRSRRSRRAPSTSSKAGRCRAAARQAREGASSRRRLIDENEAAEGRSSRIATRLQQRRRQEQEDAGALRARSRASRRAKRTSCIQGENGTGKELIANAIHYNSKRSKGPVHQDQLRGDPEGPDRVGAVRLQEGRVHRRDDRQGRPVRDGRGRLAAARRDRRDAALPADQAPARCCRSASTGRLAATGSCTSTSG